MWHSRKEKKYIIWKTRTLLVWPHTSKSNQVKHICVTRHLEFFDLNTLLGMLGYIRSYVIQRNNSTFFVNYSLQCHASVQYNLYVLRWIFLISFFVLVLKLFAQK